MVSQFSKQRSSWPTRYLFTAIGASMVCVVPLAIAGEVSPQRPSADSVHWIAADQGAVLPADTTMLQHQLVPIADAQTPVDVGSLQNDIAEGGVSLDSLIAQAEAASPKLRSAALAVEETRGRAWQAGLYPNPVAQGGAMQLGGIDSQYYGQLAQEIVTKGKLRLDKAAVCKEVTQAEMNFVRTRFDLLTAVRQGWVRTLAAERRVEVLGKLVEIARKSQQTAVKLQEGGEGSAGDTLLLDIELEKAEVALENAHSLLFASRRELAAAMGIPNYDPGSVAGSFTEPMQDYAQIGLDRGLLSQNSLLQIAQVEVERNRILLQRAQVEPCPNVTVMTGYIYETAPLNNLGVIALEMPIPVWNRNQGGIRAARANVSRSMQEVQVTENTLSEQLASAVGRYQVAQQQVNRFETKIMPRAARSLEISQQGYTQGQFDFLRLLQAQRALVEADLGYISAQETRWNVAAEIASLLQLELFP